MQQTNGRVSYKPVTTPLGIYAMTGAAAMSLVGPLVDFALTPVGAFQEGQWVIPFFTWGIAGGVIAPLVRLWLRPKTPI